MNKVESQQAVGIVVIFVLLLAYMFYFAPKDNQPAPSPTQETRSETSPPSSADLHTDTSSYASQPIDSLTRSAYGVFAPLLRPSHPEEAPITVETEDLELRFTPKGGALTALRLKKFLTYEQQPLWLIDSALTHFSSSFFYNGRRVALDELYFRSNQSLAQLRISSTDTLHLHFSAQLSDGTQLQQIYSIPATGYHINYQIKGLSSYVSNSELQIQWNQKLSNIEKNIEDLRQHIDINYYQSDTGLEELEALGAGSKQIAESSVSLEWVSVQQKFFLLSLLPSKMANKAQFSLEDLPSSSLPYLKEAQIKLPLALEDGPISTHYEMYFGPNDLRILSSVHPTFEKNLYLGWSMLGWINRTFSAPVFYALHNYFISYGVIIAILVLIVRIMLAPLTYRSYLGMAKMRLLKPEIDEIKLQHPNDVKKQQTETMRIYQLAGINPLSGCIPLLLQMPVILAMFYFFPRMIDLRQAGFLWAEDLSAYDSILTLPFHIPMYGNHVSLFTLLMTISTIFYTMLNAQIATNTPQHMKVMQYIMPIIFLVFLNSYSSGLTFYYFISNIIAMGQQFVIKYFIDEKKILDRLQENKKKNATKKKSSFQNRLEEALKQKQETNKKKTKK